MYSDHSGASGTEGSDEAETSTDEGLSMSEEDDRLTTDQLELTRIINDLDIDRKLISAAQRGDTEQVKELLADGAQVAPDEAGTTAIHIAAQNGFAEVVRLLIENGTDVDFPDSGGYTPLHKAAGGGHLDVLELLINEGCDIDTQDDMYGNTPLHEAGWHGYSKSVDLLLKNKSNAFITNRAGCTPLHLAAQSGHNQSGRTLLYGGCSPDVKNNYGDTPLHTSARYGHAGIARILISAKCSVCEQNKNGDTALHITAAFKRRKIARLLMEAHSNTKLRNKQNETAADIARRKDHPEIIDIIHEFGTSNLTMIKPSTSSAELQRKREPGHLEYSREELANQSDPISHEREAKKKSHNAFVSWIRKKFAKKSSQGKKTLNPNRRLLEGDDNSGLYSQYVKKPGFAYYRDLAGNIRQGPCGFVPACHCDKNADPIPDLPPQHLDDGIGNGLAQRDRVTSGGLKRLSSRQQYDYTDRQGSRYNNNSNRERDLRVQTEKERVRVDRQLAQVKTDLQELRGDLKSWLMTQAEDGIEMEPPHREDPFAYAIGSRQMRFGDDFDHERMAKYEVTEQFPPPPRLFRSRSDETLSHSEYSYHGRAFKSKEAAMEELKTLQHHQQLRERRKLLRAGGVNTQELEFQDKKPATSQSQPSAYSRDSQAAALINRSGSKPKLWMSKENIRTNAGCTDRPAQPGAATKKYAIDEANHHAGQPQHYAVISQAPTQLQNNQYTQPAKSTKYQLQQTIPRKQSASGERTKLAVDQNFEHDITNYRPLTPDIEVKPTPTYKHIPTTLRSSTTNLESQSKSESARKQPVATTQSQKPIPAQRQTVVKDNTQDPKLAAPGQVAQSWYNSTQQYPMLYSEIPENQAASNTTHNTRLQPMSANQPSSSQVNVPPRRPLPSYDELHNRRPTSGIRYSDQSSTLPTNRKQPRPIISSNNSHPNQNFNSTTEMAPAGTTSELKKRDSLAIQTGESCCSSSNPDSGYGGQSSDFYTGHPSPQEASSKNYDNWYNRRLQDAARRINVYSSLRPQRTMTSDV